MPTFEAMRPEVDRVIDILKAESDSVAVAGLCVTSGILLTGMQTIRALFTLGSDLEKRIVKTDLALIKEIPQSKPRSADGTSPGPMSLMSPPADADGELQTKVGQ